MGLLYAYMWEEPQNLAEGCLLAHQTSPSKTMDRKVSALRERYPCTRLMPM